MRKLVEGYFALKPLGPARIKGVREPLEIYEVTGLRPLRTRLQRAASRGYTKFVGRQREMDAIKHAAELAKSGHGQIIAAVAEAGVGKSRLFFEYKATSQSGWLMLETPSFSHGKATAYLPLIDLLLGYFEIAAEDDVRRRRQKLLGKLRSWLWLLCGFQLSSVLPIRQPDTLKRESLGQLGRDASSSTLVAIARLHRGGCHCGYLLPVIRRFAAAGRIGSS